MILAQTIPSDIDELIDVTQVTGGDVVTAVAIIIGGLIAAALIRRGIKKALQNREAFPAALVNLSARLVGYLIFIMALVFALPLLGIDLAPVLFLLLILAAIVVVIGKTLVENYGSGVILQSEGNFGPGDQIRTNGHIGEVLEVSSRTLLMETLEGKRVVIPNNSVVSNPIEVITANPVRRSELVVGLAYGTDLNAAKTILGFAVQSADGVADEPPVQVFVSEFDDSSINFKIWFWHPSDMASEMETTDAVALAVDRAVKANGLTIPFPQRTLWWGAEPKEEE